MQEAHYKKLYTIQLSTHAWEHWRKSCEYYSHFIYYHQLKNLLKTTAEREDFFLSKRRLHAKLSLFNY